MDFDALKRVPHRRLNPLTGDWVLVSPQRVQRPWQGRVETAPQPAALQYDPDCYLCPGNQRAGGVRNPAYTSTFVFENDFAALQPHAPPASEDECGSGLMVAATERGICQVVCFSPRHDLTLAGMQVADIRAVVEAWRQEYVRNGSLPYINYVEIFENRGEMMGCSNPHPHCQIWANQTIPNEPRKEQLAQQHHLSRKSSCLLCDYLELESGAGERIVCGNDAFVVLVPFWAIWPFEVLLLSRRHCADITGLNDDELHGLADILKRLATRYDNLFQVSFPYSMGFHQAPTDGANHPEWHLHAHYYPPLLRSATVRKFMVGYEMLAAPQRDFTAEAAAQALRDAGERAGP